MSENLELESYGYVEIDIDTEGCEVALKVMVKAEYCPHRQDWRVSEICTPETQDGDYAKSLVYVYLQDNEHRKNMDKQFENNATNR